MAKRPEEKLYSKEMQGKAAPKRPTARPNTPEGRIYDPEFQRKGAK